ncbi:MAG: hypothetical protein WCI18_07360 [Pseudomonadota bacterium]
MPLTYERVVPDCSTVVRVKSADCVCHDALTVVAPELDVAVTRVCATPTASVVADEVAMVTPAPVCTENVTTVPATGEPSLSTCTLSWS